MAVTQAFSGTETVSTSEWSLTTDTAGPDADTTAGCYQIMLELNNLAAGDVFELRLYEKVISGGTQRKFSSFVFANAQGVPNWLSPAFMVLHGWDATLIKISGTDRSITWSIRKA